MRSSLSTKNLFYLDKFRFNELRNFCRQYPSWVVAISEIDSLPKHYLRTYGKSAFYADPVPVCVAAREEYWKKVDMVSTAVAKAVDNDTEMYQRMLSAVTEGLSYDILERRHGAMPVSRAEWYKLYRKFFWILDKIRD
jgi:hypothetical protein